MCDFPARREARKRERATEHDLDLIRLARTTREDTMRRAGLEKDLSSARTYLGEVPASLNRLMARSTRTDANRTASACMASLSRS